MLNGAQVEGSMELALRFGARAWNGGLVGLPFLVGVKGHNTHQSLAARCCNAAGKPLNTPTLNPPTKFQIHFLKSSLLLDRQRLSSCPTHHVGDELLFPLIEAIDTLIAVHRHVARRWELNCYSRGTAQLLFGLLDAGLDAGVEDFLHLTFAERAVAGMLDAVGNVMNVGANTLQRADYGAPGRDHVIILVGREHANALCQRRGNGSEVSHDYSHLFFFFGFS